MYGARWVGNIGGGTATIKNFIAKSTEVITKGDWISIDDASGHADVAGADEPLMGIANETVTGTGSNYVEVVLALPGTLFLMDNDNDTDTFARTDVGEWTDITGTTGAQQVDTSTGAATPDANSSQLVALDYNPQGFGMDGDTSIGLYTPVYTYFASSYVE